MHNKEPTKLSADVFSEQQNAQNAFSAEADPPGLRWSAHITHQTR